MTDISSVKNNVASVVALPIDSLIKAPWNPQKQTSETFNNLVDEIEAEGFDEPILVVRHALDANKYVVIAGNHRLEAARVLGMSAIPSIIKEWDEETAKIKAVQRNMLKGELDEGKFSLLVSELKSNMSLDDDIIAKAMAFDSIDKFHNVYSEDNTTDADAAVKQQRSNIEKELEMVVNVGTVLNEIFTQSGDTITQGYIYFMYKKKIHMCVSMSDGLHKLIKEAATYMKEHDISSEKFFSDMIKSQIK